MKFDLNQFYTRCRLVLLVLLVSACSFKTFYNNLDVFIPEYVEGLVTLDDALEQAVDHRDQCDENSADGKAVNEQGRFLR